ncbi:hypothetical protein BACT_0261 [Bifidobacterium actinocoloniiforme DSM 22766]|uniref:Lipoprotein n=2 Tax=Bifidobacterium actinocoloniiforme TaxID=638619 RepID=A0A086YYS9_9BIFI|nr:hypothetical protein [Bifidobacterium actinocoloniiforme]KFI39429.1 hypothetical protein BACT_0261 [Bifidobacterium actinocoloniiforme DSM 22766]
MGRFRRCLLLLLGVFVTASGCASPIAIQRVDPHQDNLSLSSCDRAWTDARLLTRRAADPFFTSAAGARIILPLAAAQTWQDVTVRCPTRFDEAVNRSALAWMTAHTRAQQTPASPLSATVEDPGTLTTQAVQSLPAAARLLNPVQVSDAAKAEDESGFSLILLAGRRPGGDQALLSVGDRHHEAAQTLASADPTADPRQAVYSVQKLLKHPQTMTDPANGLEAPTESVVEVNCARSLTQVFRSAVSTVQDADGFGTASQGRDDRSEGPTPACHEHESTLRTLSLLATAHTYTALSQGYPAFPQALLSFVQESTAPNE